MTILKDEEGNEWVLAPGAYVHAHSNGDGTFDERGIFCRLPKKRVPFEEVDRLTETLMYDINNGISNAERLEKQKQIYRAIVREALAQMEEKAGPTQSTKP